MAINFSRSGSQIIGQYYVFMRYGMEGLKIIQKHTLDIAKEITKEIKKYKIFEVINDASNIPIVCYKLKNPDSQKWTLYELADRLAMKGWQVPAYTLPDNLNDVLIQRLVIRADFSAALAESLIKDFKMAGDYLNEHTLTDAPGKEWTGAHGFTH